MKRFLVSQGWQILGGEPPNGTCNDIIRIAIRPKNAKGRFHSLGSMKVDLVSKRGGTILLLEVKPYYSLRDKRKLELLTTERLSDLMDSLQERCKVNPKDVTCILKGLAFSYGQKHPVDTDFLYFKVRINKSVEVIKGKLLSNVEV